MEKKKNTTGKFYAQKGMDPPFFRYPGTAGHLESISLPHLSRSKFAKGFTLHSLLSESFFLFGRRAE